MEGPAIGDRVAVKFRGTPLPYATALVTRVTGRILDVEYLDGHFAGLRGIVRMSGWTAATTTKPKASE